MKRKVLQPAKKGNLTSGQITHAVSSVSKTVGERKYISSDVTIDKLIDCISDFVATARMHKEGAIKAKAWSTVSELQIEINALQELKCEFLEIVQASNAQLKIVLKGKE